MNSELEKAAEKWSVDWRYVGVCDFAKGNLNLSKYAQEEIKKRIKEAFIAGAIWFLNENKIDTGSFADHEDFKK